MKRERAALNVAIEGFGSIGHRHFENVQKLGVSRRVVVRRREANPAFMPDEGARVVHSTAAALAEQIDAAIICNPSRLHVETARRYVEAGVAVLVEKPLGGDLGEARRLVEMAERRGVAAGMAYCMRYHPAYALARDAIAAGRLGRVLYAKAWFETYLPDWHPWEDYRQSYAARNDLGGGAAATLDHEIDFLNACLGAPQWSLRRGFRTGALDMEADDLAALLLGYPDVALATATLSLCRKPPSRGFEIVGERGSLRFRFEDATLAFLDAGAASAPAQELWREPGYDLNRMYLDTLDAFLTAVVHGAEAPIPLAAGLASARAIAGISPA